MRFGRTHKLLTFALVAVAVTPVLTSGEIGVPFQFALPLAAAIGWWLEPPLTRNRWLRRSLTGALLLFFAVQVARFLAGEPMAKLGMEFAAMLLGAKLMTRGSAGDYYQIVALSFLHIIAGTVAINDLTYAVSFLVFVGLSSPMLALSYLRREMESRFAAAGSGEGGPEMLRRLLLSKRVVSPRFLAGTSLLSLPILGVTVVLFILFPRVSVGLFGQLPEAADTAGFGNVVKLSDLDLLRQDNAVLIRLEPIGPPQAAQPYLGLRLRGAVFDTYENDIWKKKSELPWEHLYPNGNDYAFQDDFILKPSTPGFLVLLESLQPPLLFVPEGTGMITTFPVSEEGLPRPRTIEQNRLGALRYKDDAKVGIRYKVYLTGAPPLGDPPDDEESYLDLPPGSDRLKALARSFAGQGPPQVLQERLVQRIRSSYRYETRTESAGENRLEQTPLDRFLFSRRTGTCSHFATALTLMLRAVGIPARMVTGFAGAEWNAVGGYYAVRKTFAHAWTEAFIDGRWVPLDATPAAAAGPKFDLLYQLALIVDTFRMRWHKNVVSYDAASQFEIALALHSRVSRIRAERGEGGGWSVPAWPFWTLAGLAGIAWSLYRLGGILRWPLPRLRGPGRRRRVHDATRLYRRLERRLARRGFPRPRFLTPGEHLDRIGQDARALADAAGPVVRRYNEARFGRRDFEPREFEKLDRLVRGL